MESASSRENAGNELNYWGQGNSARRAADAWVKSLDFILCAGHRMVSFKFLCHLTPWRWNWKGQDGRPRVQERGLMEGAVKEGAL